MDDHAQDATLPPNLPDDVRASFDPSKSSFAALEIETEARPAAPASSGGSAPTVAEPRPTAPEPEPEAEDAEPFEYRKVLGRGGFGVVWEGVQKKLKRKVALKTLREEVRAPEDRKAALIALIARSIREEALTAAQLDHPNIVPVYDISKDARGFPILAMKLVRGKPWSAVIAEDFPGMTAEEFLAKHIPILLSVAQAVAFAHSRGIIHRDLKPEQVMLGDFGEVLLMDWGLAVSYDREALTRETALALGSAPEASRASSPAGTPAFMAPEQTRDTGDQLGTHTDVYLLGGILYYLLTNKPPHTGGSKEQVWFQACNGTYTDPVEYLPKRQHPEDLLHLMRAALKPGIAERKLSPAEFLTAPLFVQCLKDHLSGEGRRRESKQVTRLVSAQLEKGKASYEQLSDLIAELSRARSLWAGNPELPGLRQQAFLKFADLALANGDIVLARVQATRLDPGPEKTALKQRVREAAALEARQHRVRKASLVAVVALLGVVAAGGIAFSRRLARENRETEFALQMASERNSQFDALLESMVSLGQADEAVKLAAESARAARAIAERSGSIAPKAARLDAVMRYAELVRSQGTNADVQYKEAAGYAEELGALQPDAPQWTVDWAAAQAALSRNELQTDRPRGIARLAETLDRLEALDEKAINELRIRRKWAEVLDRAGQYIGPSDAVRAERAVRRAFAAFEAMAAEAPDDTLLKASYAVSCSRMARLLSGTEAEALYERQLALRRELHESDPANRAWKSDFGRAYGTLASHLNREGELEAALAAADKSFAIAEELASGNRKNRKWQRDRLSAAVRRENIWRKLRKAPEEALHNIEAALAHYREVNPAQANDARDRAPLAANAAIACCHLDAGKIELARPIIEALAKERHWNADLAALAKQHSIPYMEPPANQRFDGAGDERREAAAADPAGAPNAM